MDFSLIPIPYYEFNCEEQYEPLYGLSSMLSRL